MKIAPTEGSLTPIFCSVKQAAEALNLSPWEVYQLLDEGAIKSKKRGRRRLVIVTSLYDFADSLADGSDTDAAEDVTA